MEKNKSGNKVSAFSNLKMILQLSAASLVVTTSAFALVIIPAGSTTTDPIADGYAGCTPGNCVVATTSSSIINNYGTTTIGGAVTNLNSTTTNVTSAGTTTITSVNNTFTSSTTNINSSSTTITGTTTVQSFVLGTLTGILTAINGVVGTGTVSLINQISGVLGVLFGGTGTTTAPTYGQMLVGNSAGGYDLLATSSLGLSASNLTNNSTTTIAAPITNVYSSTTNLTSTTTNISSSATTTITSSNTTINSPTTNINSSSTTINGTTTVQSFVLGTLTGILTAINGVVGTGTVSLINQVAGILGISFGGTGTSTAPTYGQILVGNSGGTYDLVSTSTLGNQTYASTSIGADVAGASATGIFFIDPATGKLAQDTANFSYDPVAQKLHVSGILDPLAFVAQGTSTNNNAYFESFGGENAGLSINGTSASSTGRIRYNTTTHNWEVSTNGGAYTPLAVTGGDISFVNATGSMATISVLAVGNLVATGTANFANLIGTNATFTNATTTNLFSQLANFLSVIINTLTAYTINAGIINATSSVNTLVSNASTTNASTTNAGLLTAGTSTLGTSSIAQLTVFGTTILGTVASATASDTIVLVRNQITGEVRQASLASIVSSTSNTVSYSTSTGILTSIVNGLAATTSLATLSTTTISALTANVATFTAATSTNLFANIFSTLSAFITSLIFTNATGTNLAVTGTTTLTGSTTASGGLNLAGAKITNVGAPTSNLDATNKSYVDALVQGLAWKDPVIAFATTTIASPATGARYIVGTTSVIGLTPCAFNDICQYDGTTWFTPATPVATATTVYVNQLATSYTFNGSSWVSLGASIQHNSLVGLQGGNGGTEEYHLNLADYTNLTTSTAQLANLQTTGTNTFASTTITNGLNVLGTLWANILSVLNFSATNGTITNATSTNIATANLTATGTITNSGTTTLATTTITNGNVTNLVAGNSTTTNSSTTNLFSNNASITNATTTSLFAMLLNALNAIFGNSTTTNATTTGYFASTGTSTLSTTTVSGLSILQNGLTLASATPATSTYALYNNAGVLYWNGTAVGTGSGGGSNFANLLGATSTLFSETALRDGNTTLGTTSTTTANVSGVLTIVGNLSNVLSTAVSVTTGFVVASTTGTGWATNLSIGDSIKITVGTSSTQYFTVTGLNSSSSISLSGSSVVTSAAATVSSDNNLLSILTGTGASKLTVDKSGNLSANAIYSDNIYSAGLTWTSRSAGGPQPIASVYGSGVYVMVGQGLFANNPSYSKDGINWINTTTPINFDFTGVTYGNGLFVGIQSGSNVVTSSDGITWTARTLPTSLSWTSIAYGNNKFVAVASNGATSTQVIYSANGKDWFSTNSASNVTWKSVTYGNGKFVAVADSGTASQQVMTSTDGITWTAATAAVANTWASVTYGGGKFLAVANNSSSGNIMTSINGSTWTTGNILVSDASWKGVTYGGGLYVAVGQFPPTGKSIVTSPDGINWTPRNNSGFGWFNVSYGNGMFIATGPFDGMQTSGKFTPEKDNKSLFASAAAFLNGFVTGTTTTATTSNSAIFNVLSQKIISGTINMMNATTTGTTTSIGFGTTDLLVGDNFRTDQTGEQVFTVTAVNSTTTITFTPITTATVTSANVYRAPNQSLVFANVLGSVLAYFDRLGILNTSGVTLTQNGNLATTSNTVYNNNGNLYFNGQSLSNSFSTNASTTYLASTTSNLAIGTTTANSLIAIQGSYRNLLASNLRIDISSSSASTTGTGWATNVNVGDPIKVMSTTSGNVALTQFFTVSAVYSTSSIALSGLSATTSYATTSVYADGNLFQASSANGTVGTYINDQGQIVMNQGTVINSGTPNSGTTNALYNQGGSLYFNGNQLASGQSTLNVIFDSNLSLGSAIDLYNSNGAIHARSVIQSGTGNGGEINTLATGIVVDDSTVLQPYGNIAAWMSSNSILVAMRNGGATNYRVRAATLSGVTPTFGSTVAVANVNEIDAVIAMPRTWASTGISKAVLLGNNTPNNIVVATTSGNSVSIGTAGTLGFGQGSPGIKGVETAVNEVAVFGATAATPVSVDIVDLVPGTNAISSISSNIQVDTTTAASASNYGNTDIAVVATTSATSTIAVAYANTNNIYVRVGDINSTTNTIVWGSAPVQITTGAKVAGNYVHIASYANRKLALLYHDSTNSNKLTVQLVDISGLNIPSANASGQVITSDITTTTCSQGCDIKSSGNGIMLISSSLSNAINQPQYIYPVTIVGSTINLGARNTANSSGYNQLGNEDLALSPDGTAFIQVSDTDATNYYPRLAIGYMSSAITDLRSNYFGLVSSSTVANATGTVTLYGNIISNLSALTAGATYYLDTAGQLTTSVTNYIAGKALSATQLSINAAQGLNSTASTNVVASYLNANVNFGTTSVNVGASDHVKYDTVTSQYGTDISLDTSTSYVTTSGVASIGRITLKAGKTYKLSGTVPWFQCGGTDCYANLQWFNADTNVALGQTTREQAVIRPVNETSVSTNEVFFTPTQDTRVEFRLTNSGGNIINQIGPNSGAVGSTPYVSVQVVAGNAAVTGQSVDYVRATPVTQTLVTATPADVAAFTVNEGNVIYGSGLFTLKAGKTYRLNANLSMNTQSTAAAQVMQYEWETAAGVAISSKGINGSPISTDNTAFAPATGYYTPTADTQVKVRITALTLSGNGSLNASWGNIEITQVGTTATTEYTNNILGNFPTGGVVMSGTLSQYTNFLQIAQTTTGQTLSLPNPDNASSSRIVYIDNTGTANFQMHGVTVGAGESNAFKWNGTTWKSFGNQANNVAAEYGENNSITDGSTMVNGTATLIPGSSFTLPTAGVWEVNYILNFANNTTASMINTAVYDNSGTIVSNSNSGAYGGNTGSGTDVQNIGQVRITTSGAATYSLRAIANAAGITIKNNNAAQTISTAQSKISWQKISGYIPVSGQSVDFAEVNLTTNASPINNSAIVFNTLSAGSIPYNTTTGQFTLSAGKTYSMQSNVIVSASSNISASWYNVTTGTLIGNTSQFNSDYSTAGAAGSNQASAVITPSATTIVELRNVTGATRTIIGGALGVQSSSASVRQLGSSAFTSDSILSVGGNQFTTGSTSGFLSIGSLNNANINFIASSTNVGGFMLATSSSNSASTSAAFFIGTTSPNSNLLYNIGLYIEAAVAKLAKRTINGTDVGAALVIDSATSSVASTTNALYALNGLLYWNGMQLNYGSTTATSSTQAVASYVFAKLSADQSANRSGGVDHITFNSISNSFGGDVTLDTASAYSTTLGAPSIGRITLKAGKTYRLRAGAATGVASGNLQIYFRNVNSGQGAQIPGTTQSFGDSTTQDTISTADGIFTPSVDTLVEVFITSNTGPTNIQAANSFVDIQVISGNAAVTGQSVDYVSVNRAGTSYTPPGGTGGYVFDTNVAGNIPYNTSTGQFTLTAGKTYKLDSSIQITLSNNSFSWQWYNVTSGAYFGTSAFETANDISNINGNQQNAVAYITPTVNTVVELRVSNAYLTNPTPSRSYATIQQLGTTATTEYSNNILGNFTSSSTLNSTNILGASTTLLSSFINFFQIAQASSSIDLILPTPQNSNLSRIVYIDNTGTANFTMHGVTVGAGESAAFKWNGTTWKSFGNQAANVAAEYGEAVLGGTATILAANTSSANTLNVMSFTLPTAGVWEVTSSVRGNATAAARAIDFGIYDSTPTLVANSETQVDTFGGASGVVTGTSVTRVTTTGPATYSLRAWDTSASGAATILSDANGRTKVSYKKISGYIPVIGQSVDYNTSSVSASTPSQTTNTNVVSTTIAGNIPNTSGAYTLTAGKTYELTASIYGNTNGDVNGSMSYWFTTTSAGAIGTAINGVSAASSPLTTSNANFPVSNLTTIYTPSTNQTIYLVVTMTSASARNITGGTVGVKQLGTTAFTSATILANGGNIGSGATVGTQDNNNVLFIASSSQVMALLSNSSSTQINTSLSFAAGTTITAGGNNILLPNASLVRISTSSAITITGFASSSNATVPAIDGRIVYLMNTGSSTVTLANASALSATSSQITTGTGSDLSMAAGSAITMMYDSVNTTWRIIGGSGSGTNVAAVNGEVTTIVDGQTFTNTLKDIQGSTTTIPSAGTWQITYYIYGGNGVANAQNNIGLYDNSTNVIVTDSNGVQTNPSGAPADSVLITNSVYVTTTGPAVYKLRGITGAINTFTVRNNSNIGSGSNGDSKILFNKISGNVPVTGQSVDYARVNRNSNQAFSGNNQAIQFNTLESGSIPVNTTNGQITLSPGKTYVLRASAVETTGGSTARPTFNWYNVTAGGNIGNQSGLISVNDAASNSGPSTLSEAIITPTVTTIVEFRLVAGFSAGLTLSSGDYTGGNNQAAWATIEQLGSSAITGDSMWAVGGNAFSTTSSSFNFGSSNNNNVLLMASSSTLISLLANSSSTQINTALSFAAGTSITSGGNNILLPNSSLVRISALTAITITGFASSTNATVSPVDGRIVYLMNTATNTVTLSNQSALSATSSRITTGTGADLTIAAGSAVTLMYDLTNTTWRVYGGSGGGSLSSLTAATASSNIDNGNNTLTWNWNTMTNSGLNIYASTSAATNFSSLFNVWAFGTSTTPGLTTFASEIYNTHIAGANGTNVGLYSYVGAASTSIAIQALTQSTTSANSYGGVMIGKGYGNTIDGGWYSQPNQNLLLNYYSTGGVNVANGGGYLLVGPYTYTPSTKFEVYDANTAGAVSRFFNNTASTCSVTPGGLGFSCSSDARLKQNILSIDSTSTLDKILALKPVTFNWISDATGSAVHSGFIAQDVAPIFPDMVSTDTATGMFQMNYGNLTPYLTKALQELNNKIFSSATVTAVTIDEITASTTISVDAKIKALGMNAKTVNDMLAQLASSTSATTTSTTTTDINGLVTSTTTETFIGKLITRIVEEVKAVFAKQVVTEEICVGTAQNKTCLTKTQLDNLISNSGSNSGNNNSNNSGGNNNPNSSPNPSPDQTPAPDLAPTPIPNPLPSVPTPVPAPDPAPAPDPTPTPDPAN